MLFNVFIWFAQDGGKSHVSAEINSKKDSKSWRNELFCDCDAIDNTSQLSCPFSLKLSLEPLRKARLQTGNLQIVETRQCIKGSYR